MNEHAHPSYLDRAIQDRAEAQARVAELLIVGGSAAANLAGRALVSAGGRVARAYRLWRRRRKTRLELSRLDDHLLRDIGIAPDEIDAIAWRLTEEEEAPTRAPKATTREPRLVLDCPNLRHAA